MMLIMMIISFLQQMKQPDTSNLEPAMELSMAVGYQ
jgi:hypothetical protein